jgi:hypothetical protein
MFITATLPAEVRYALVEPVLKRHALGWTPLRNPSLKAALAGDQLYLTTRGHCDCDSALGRLGRWAHQRPAGDGGGHVGGAAGAPAGASQAADPEVARLRKKGWGEAKIRRWLAQRAQAAANWQRAEAVRAEAVGSELREAGETGEAQRWLEALRELVSAPLRLKHVGLLLHQYPGGLEGERITVARRQSVSAAALDLQLLLELEEDVLYRFGR